MGTTGGASFPGRRFGSLLSGIASRGQRNQGEHAAYHLFSLRAIQVRGRHCDCQPWVVTAICVKPTRYLINPIVVEIDRARAVRVRLCGRTEPERVNRVRRERSDWPGLRTQMFSTSKFSKHFRLSAELWERKASAINLALKLGIRVSPRAVARVPSDRSRAGARSEEAVADLRPEPRQSHCGVRYLRGAHGALPPVLRVRHDRRRRGMLFGRTEQTV